MQTSIQNLNNNKQTLTTKTTTMKTLTLTMTSLFLSVLMIFTSCSKNQEMINPTQPNDVLSQEFLTDLENMSYEYTTDQGQRIWPIIGKFALADAMGGLSTYAMHNGTSSWEVLAAGAGAASISYGLFRLGPLEVDTLPVCSIPWFNDINKYVEVTSINPKNYMENIGILHNQYVPAILTQWSKDNNGIYAATNSILNGKAVMKEKMFKSINSSIMACKGEQDFIKFINNSTFPQATKLILSNYITVMFNAKSIAAFQKYSVNVESMVAGHKGLKKETKDGLLLTMSIAKHSANLWNSVL